MKTLIKFVHIALILVFTTQFTFGQSKNKPLCAKFQTGTFELVHKEHNVNHLIKRTKKYQFEYDLNNKDIALKFKVNWLSDCEYTLDIIKAKKEDDIYNFFKGKTLHILITETEGDEYTFTCRFKGFSELVIPPTRMKKIK